MTTTTRPKTASRTNDLLALEAERDRLHEELTTLRHEHSAAKERTEDLTAQRRRIIARDPGLVDHRGQPVNQDGPVAAIDAALGDLADPGDLYAQVQHTERLEASAQIKVDQFIADHRGELLAEHRASDDQAAVAARWRSAVEAITCAGSELHAIQHRRDQLGGERNDRLVDSIHNAISVAQGVEVDA